MLKALGLLHKSDAGGVVVGIASREALLDAHARLVAKLDPPSFSVEEMADLRGGVELIVGARWDPRFGPTVLVGMGGTATEVLRDVQVALAPVDEDEAARMLAPAAHRAAARRAPRSARRRHRRRRTGGGPPQRSTPRPTPRSPSSRSTRCSSPRRERPLSTPESSSTS